jgi:hypothetical protein
MTLSANRKRFEKLLQDWVVIEDKSINAANDLMGKSKNPMVTAIIDLVKQDSEKHRNILKAIQYNLDHAVTFTNDDMKMVDTFITNHAAMEKNAVETAEQALEMSSLPIPRFLLENLLLDEKRHDAYMEELNELKMRMAKGTQ